MTFIVRIEAWGRGWGKEELGQGMMGQKEDDDLNK